MAASATNNDEATIQKFVLASDGTHQFIIEESFAISVDGQWLTAAASSPSPSSSNDAFPLAVVGEEILSSPLPQATAAATRARTTRYRPILMKVPDLPPEPIPVSEHYRQVRQENVPTCFAEVATASLKELRLKGSSFLRAHASKHGITNASRKLTSQVITELRRHYALAHLVKVVEDDNDPKNSYKSKRGKKELSLQGATSSPSSSTSSSKSPSSSLKKVNRKIPLIHLDGTCSVHVLAKSLSELAACGTSLLRPEAALHRVHNASRKSKDVVIAELWQHYLDFHSDQLRRALSDSESAPAVNTSVVNITPD